MDYLETVSELNYLTQIVIMLYEDSSEEIDSEKRFHVELHFSPGAYGCFDVPPDVFHQTSYQISSSVTIFLRLTQLRPMRIQFVQYYQRVIEKQLTVHHEIKRKHY